MSGNKITNKDFHNLDNPKRELILPKKKIFKALGDLTNKSVADVGSGTGYYTKDLVSLTSPKGTVYCLDVSEELLEILKTRTKDMERIHYVLMGESNIPIDDYKIDAVMVILTSHEFEDPVSTFKEIHRILKTGGKLVVADWSPGGFLKEGAPKNLRIHKKELIKHCENAGFRYNASHIISTEVYMVSFNA